MMHGVAIEIYGTESKRAASAGKTKRWRSSQSLISSSSPF